MTQHNSNTSSKIEECTTPSAKQTITTARATRSGHFCRVRRKCPSGRTAGSLCAGVSQKPRGPWPPPTLCPPLSSASICPGRFCQPWNVKTLTHSHAASSAVHAACCAVLCCAVLCCAVLCCAVLCCAVQKQAGPLKGLLAVSCFGLLLILQDVTWMCRGKLCSNGTYL